MQSKGQRTDMMMGEELTAYAIELIMMLCCIDEDARLLLLSMVVLVVGRG